MKPCGLRDEKATMISKITVYCFYQNEGGDMEELVRDGSSFFKVGVAIVAHLAVE
jgi:hypothetical protein